jgi:hypothetical protein
MAGFFSKLKGKDGAKAKKNAQQETIPQGPPPRKRWDDAWTRTTVEADEVQELIRGCTVEIKSRGTKLFPLEQMPLITTQIPHGIFFYR